MVGRQESDKRPLKGEWEVKFVMEGLPAHGCEPVALEVVPKQAKSYRARPELTVVWQLWDAKNSTMTRWRRWQPSSEAGCIPS